MSHSKSEILLGRSPCLKVPAYEWGMCLNYNLTPHLRSRSLVLCSPLSLARTPADYSLSVILLGHIWSRCWAICSEVGKGARSLSCFYQSTVCPKELGDLRDYFKFRESESLLTQASLLFVVVWGYFCLFFVVFQLAAELYQKLCQSPISLTAVSFICR